MACPGNRHCVSAHFRSLYKSQADCRIYELLTCVEWMRDGADRQTDTTPMLYASSCGRGGQYDKCYQMHLLQHLLYFVLHVRRLKRQEER